MSKPSRSIAALGVFMTLAAAASGPGAGPDGTDFSALPAPPRQVESQVAASKVSLLQAVAIAEKALGGKASSSAMRLGDPQPSIEVVVYAQGQGRRVLIDAASGAVISTTPVPRFPGEPTASEAVEKPSGLTYYDTKVGDGEEVKDSGSVVQVHLTAWLVDGKEIFSTRGQKPTNLLPGSLTTTLTGLQEAFIGMKAGGKRKIVLPPALAYGERGQSPAIPPNAALILDVELLGINPFEHVPAILPGEKPVGEPVKTDSGLTYYDLVVGSGDSPPDKNAIVKVLHTGYLTDGTIIESSAANGKPAQFPLGAVIPGWAEGISTMKVGGKRKLIIPCKLAFGEQGNQGIPPRATLIFDVELVEISAPPSPPATNPAAR